MSTTFVAVEKLCTNPKLALICSLNCMGSSRMMVLSVRHWRLSAVPSHSTFSKNRRGRFQESKIFEQLFQEIVGRCVASGLVQGDHLSVDGSFIQADASNASRIPREQLSEAAHVNRNVRQYLDDLQRENPLEPELHQQDKVSTANPDATYFSKGDKAPTPGYFDNYVIDNASCVIAGVEATDARPSQEIASAHTMLSNCIEKFRLVPKTLAADTEYGKAEFLTSLCGSIIHPAIIAKDLVALPIILK